MEEEQAGFRKNRSTVDQLFIMHEVIKGRRPNKTFCCFLDLEKAYDRVWRDGLWKKLHEYGLRGKMWRTVKKIYERVESCVLVDGKSTGFFTIEVGVRQGCILSPILFDLFINGLAEVIKRIGKGVFYGNVRISILMFADDIVLIADNKKDLQLLMDLTYAYSRRWRFNFNFAKSAVVVFENGRDPRPIFYGDCKSECRCGKHWKLGDTLIVETDVYKYLGVELDTKLTFKQFKERIADKARKNRARVWNMGMSKGDLSVPACINLWEALVRCNLEYGAEVWGAGTWEEAELVAREMGRRILRCSSKTTTAAVLGELGWWELSTRRDLLQLKYWLSILLMEETRLVKQVYNHSKAEFLRNGQGNWVKIIYQLVCKYDLEPIWDSEEDFRVGQENKTDKEIRQVWGQIIANSIHQKAEEKWRKLVQVEKDKLRTYRTFKTKLELEPYLLSEQNKLGRYLLTSLRSGTNKLRIETGRWKKPKEDKEDRVCMTCMDGAVEDEKHFLLHCVAYEALREKLFRDICLASERKVDLKNADQDTRWEVLMQGVPGQYKKPIFECVKLFVRAALWRRSRV